MTTVYEKIINKLDLRNETKLLVVHQDDIGMCHGAPVCWSFSYRLHPESILFTLFGYHPVIPGMQWAQ